MKSHCCNSDVRKIGGSTLNPYIKYYCLKCDGQTFFIEEENTNPQPPIEGWKKSLDRFDKQFFDRDVIENYRKLKSIYKYASTDKFIVDIEKFIVQELQAKDNYYKGMLREIGKLKEDNGFDGVGYKRAIEDVKEILKKHNININ